MVKRHLKRLAVPKTWQIKRKGITFIKRPNPGAHPLKLGLSLNTILIDMIKIAKTNKEVNYILNKEGIKIDSLIRKESRHLVGFMDVISIPKTKEHYRVVLNKKGKIHTIKIKESEANLKVCKIIGKNKIKKKMQLNLNDSRNILIEKDSYKVGDSILITLPGQQIKEHYKFAKGSIVYLIGGKHSGSIGAIENIEGNKITYKMKSGDIFETLKKYAFVVGVKKQGVTIEHESK